MVCCIFLFEVTKMFNTIKAKKIDDKIYEINGFQIRFFTKEQIESFLANYFEIKTIEESYEEPVSLYFVFCYKM